MLSKQSIDKQQVSVFLRDLTSDFNINLKHIIEDTFLKQVEKSSKKSYHKKKQVKKKDIIIQQQNIKRKKIDIEDDKQKIDYLMDSFPTKELISKIVKLKTDEGKDILKCNVLEKLWEEKPIQFDTVLLLYYDLKDKDLPEKQNKIVEKIENKIKDIPIKEHMLKNMGHLLEPLNPWSTRTKQLDDWQIQVIEHIKKRKSVIVKAPTSSGKSFIAMSCGIFFKKLLYVCPAKPVAYQVGAHFIHMGYKVHFIVDNLSHHSYDSMTNIFIGTPNEIENCLPKLGIKYDYAVFDEIHNINSNIDGHIYENIIRMIPCNFLSLSATIQNIGELKDVFQKIHPEKSVELVEYSQRFMNQQKWLWTAESKLEKIHPLSSYGKVDESFKNSSLMMTPNNCSELWDIIEEEFEENPELISGCSPDEYFAENKLITLQESSQYETFLKEKLIELNKTESEKVTEILSEFQTESKPASHSMDTMFSFLKTSKSKEMFPMIMFHTDEFCCKDLFMDMYLYLHTKEIEEYPYHYDILEMKQKLYNDFLDKKESFISNLTIQKNTTDSLTEKNKKVDRFVESKKNEFIHSMLNYYDHKIRDVERSDNLDEIKHRQIKNLIKEKRRFESNPDFNSQDIFKKHSDFVFTNREPMSGDVIREVRREIIKTLGIKVSYESYLFQMLKRGIGLYVKNMPDEYNWIIQKLLSKKLISVVISDKTLCMGIDLPVRSSCFLGINNSDFTREDYLQMSGRAGRRGKDTQGNIIFYGDMDYKSLIQGNLPKIVGSDKLLHTNYDVMKDKLPIAQIYKNRMKPLTVTKVDDSFMKDIAYTKLFWNLRPYKNCSLIAEELSNNIEKKLYDISDHEKEVFLLRLVSKLLDISFEEVKTLHKFKKITSHNELVITKEINEALINIHNSLNNNFTIVKKTCQSLFKTLNYMFYVFLL